MEMNKYLIAALYVMAGCAVAIPLKTGENSLPLRGEGCRLVITDTIKVVSAYFEEKEAQQEALSPDHNFFSIHSAERHFSLFEQTVRLEAAGLCRTSHKIRAPELS